LFIVNSKFEINNKLNIYTIENAFIINFAKSNSD